MSKPEEQVAKLHLVFPNIPKPVAVYRPATDESLAFTPDVEMLLREGRIGEAMVR